MQRQQISLVGLTILPAYFGLTILIGWLSRRHSDNANAFLNASRSLPLWIVTASFIAANCGALEIVGLSAMAAQYGVEAFHFYWIGAIPAMVFLSLWMMPAYMKSGVRSVPEYLGMRFGPRVQLLNAWVSALTMLMLAGISLYAMAQVLEVVLGISFFTGAIFSASTILVYVLLGGVRATIYTEVFQLLVMIAGLVPLCWRCLRFARAGNLSMTGDPTRWHLWHGMPLVSTHSRFDAIGVVFGLGFVLSFSYWCTDFVLMQRALASRTESHARQVPLWAGFGKLGFSLLVVLPGLAAHRIFPLLGSLHRFDQTLPLMMTRFYGSTLLGLGLTALAASLMSGLAANVSGLAAVWTEDIYRVQFVPGREEKHYLRVGQVTIVVAVVGSILASYISFHFADLMEHVQLIFSLFAAPFWAVFLLGMISRRISANGALWGFTVGITCGVFHHVCVMRHWITYGSVMSANFHAALYAFTSAFIVGWMCNSNLQKQSIPANRGLTIDWADALRGKRIRLLWALSALLLTASVLLNYVWR